MRSRILAATMLPLLTVGLAGCASQEPPPCPPIFILADTANLIQYRDGPGRDLTDVELEGEIMGYVGGCHYDDEGAVVDLQVSFKLKRGPADTDRKVSFEYFLAVPAYYPAPEAKAVFPVTVEFPESTNMVRYRDALVDLRLPVKDGEVLDNKQIFIGFQTTAEQLRQNRQTR